MEKEYFFVGKNITWKNYKDFPWLEGELMMGQSKKSKDFFQECCGLLSIIDEKIITSFLQSRQKKCNGTDYSAEIFVQDQYTSQKIEH